MKKLLNIMLSLILACSSFVMPQMVSAEDSKEQASVDIYPTPQSIRLENGGMKFEGSVDVIIHGEQDEATLPKLEAILKAENIDYAFKETVNENHATIILATDCKSCAICDSVSDPAGALSESQGYVLKVEQTKNPKGSIKIVGFDADGVYYGVMTLKQLFDQKASDGSIAKVNVSDYPDVKFRGYIEGFYGIPWSHEDRAELFKDTTYYKMTTYIYAPKDDPYHRGSWRDLYPAKESQQLKELCDIAAQNNMEFCWTIHPGADYNYSKDSDGNGQVDDFEKLITKFEQVYAMGVRQFGIFYDDLDYAVANASRHAQVINDAYTYLTNKYQDVKPMITVVTRYTNSWGASWSSYFTPFMQQVHEDTLVLWTGQSTMSAITKAYMEYPKTQTGINRDFGVWWNYPVNDYQNSNLFMAPLDCLDNDVDNIATFFLNPMSEADASRVAIYSGADYAWNIEDFNSSKSWDRAIEELVPDAKEAFARFADNISYLDQGNGFLFDESVYLKADIERFKQATGDDLMAEVLNMKAQFSQMLSDCDELKNMQRTKLYDEIQYHLAAYENIAQAGLATMTAYEAALNGNAGLCLSETSKMNANLEAATTHYIPTLNDELQVQLCTQRILPFINEQATKISQVLTENLAKEKDAQFITSLNKFEKEVDLTRNVYGFKDFNETLNAGEYVGIKLPKVMNIRNTKVKVSASDSLNLQYSLNGIVWYDLPFEIHENELESDMIVTAAYIRLVSDVQTTLNIESFNVEVFKNIEMDETTVSPTISTNLPTYMTYNIESAMDGNKSSCFWSSTGSSDGSSLSVDLKKDTILDKVEIYSGINIHGVVDGFDQTQLEVSDDGVKWNAVGAAKSVAEYEDVDSNMKKLVFNLDGVIARYFRLRAVGASESWAKVYEITYSESDDYYGNCIKVKSNMFLESGKLEAVLDDYDNSFAQFTSTTDKDYVQIDLGMIEPLYDVSIAYANNKSFDGTVLKTSVDGKTWKEVSTLTFDEYVVNGNLPTAEFVCDGRLVRYIRFEEVNTSANAIKVYEIRYNQHLEITGTPSVSTNMSPYKTDYISKVLDGNMATKFYSNAGAKVGDYIQVDFGTKTSLYNTAIYFGGDPNNAGNVDGYHEIQLQVSNDGTAWENIGSPLNKRDYLLNDGKYVAFFDIGGVSARYLRFTSNVEAENWIQAYEIEFNQAMDENTIRYADESSDGIVEFYPSEAYINGSTVDIINSNLLDDGDMDTYAELSNVKAGDALVYPMNVITSVKSIYLFQGENAISNAQIKVLKTDGTWVDAGIFDDPFKTIECNATILAVQLIFNGTQKPQIYEIMVEEADEILLADYTLIDQAITKVPADLSQFTDESVAVLETALNQVVRGLDASQQALVDAMAIAIEDALASLTEKLSAPTAPKNVKVKQSSYKEVVVSWSPVKGATEYDVYRKSYKETSKYVLVKTLSETSYKSTGLMTGKNYSYYVVAKNEAGSSPQSVKVSIATKLTGTVKLSIKQASKTKFTLSWNRIDGATRYIIYNKRNQDSWKKVLTLGAKVLSYTTAEMPEGNYSYIVKAARYDSVDRVMTDKSNAVEGTSIYTRPSLTLTAGSKQVKVSWKAVEGVIYYELYKATQEKGTYTKLITTKNLTYTSKSLKSGKTYYYKLRGYKSYNNGETKKKIYTDYSAIKSIKAK